MVSALISKVIMLVFGTLYPAYRSYKAIKNKDVREYVKWMMYWIIFALFITTETFADVFLSWIPLYYEVKIVFIIWLLSPATRGSSIIYRKFIHPRLVKHEKSIDKYISEAQKNGYAALLHVGKKGLNAAGETIVKTAASGQTHLIQTLRRYNSMQDLSTDEVDARHRPQSWYYGMPAADSNFDPDDDVAVLQNQYKASRQRDFIREDSQAESAHSQADSLYDEKHNSNPALSVTNDERTDNYNENIDDADPNEIPYDSQTMPRMRKTKERKPLAGVFPDAKKTRAGRVTSRDARDQKTKSSAF